MKILYILKHDPWSVGGGCYASRSFLYAFLSIFKNAEFDILMHPICVKKVPESIRQRCNILHSGERTIISKILAPFSGVMHRYQSTAKELLKKRQYDYVIFDHSSIAGSLVPFVPKTTKSIVINHNFEPQYFKDNSHPIISFFMLRSVRRNEKKAYLRCSYNVFLTEEDYMQFQSYYGETLSKCSVIGMFDSTDLLNEKVEYTYQYPPKIVISGSLSNVQNIDGIKYFFSDLYPEIPREWSVIITGKHPSDEVIEYCGQHDNVTLIPDPENIEEIVNKCDVFLCPTRLGSGIKVRIGDGLRQGLPVLAHSVSSRGYGDYIRNGVLLSFNSSHEFSKCLREIQRKLEKKELSRENIMKLYRDLSSFSCGVERLKKELTLKI